MLLMKAADKQTVYLGNASLNERAKERRRKESKVRQSRLTRKKEREGALNWRSSNVKFPLLLLTPYFQFHFPQYLIRHRNSTSRVIAQQTAAAVISSSAEIGESKHTAQVPIISACVKWSEEWSALITTPFPSFSVADLISSKHNWTSCCCCW